MNTEKDTINDSLIQAISERLVTARQELDELIVQLSLGKADAKDKYQEIKKEFALRMRELKDMVRSKVSGPEGKALAGKIAELEELLGIGKIDTQAQFDEQKKKILDTLATIETAIKNKFLTDEALNHFTNEFEKFKLKMEILRLRFAVKKFEIKDTFRSGVSDVQRIVQGIGRKLHNKKSSYSDFSDEIRSAYQHFKKAINHL
jgi:hypothetical protein